MFDLRKVDLHSMEGRRWGSEVLDMDNQGKPQQEEEARVSAEDWAEAEWFQEWLRLARREYQGHPEACPEFRQAA